MSTKESTRRSKAKADEFGQSSTRLFQIHCLSLPWQVKRTLRCFPWKRRRLELPRAARQDILDSLIQRRRSRTRGRRSGTRASVSTSSHPAWRKNNSEKEGKVDSCSVLISPHLLPSRLRTVWIMKLTLVEAILPPRTEREERTSL